MSFDTTTEGDLLRARCRLGTMSEATRERASLTGRSHLASLGAGEGFRNRHPQRAVIHARSAKFCWFREPGPRQGTTQNDAVRDRVGQLVGNGRW